MRCWDYEVKSRISHYRSKLFVVVLGLYFELGYSRKVFFTGLSISFFKTFTFFLLFFFLSLSLQQAAFITTCHLGRAWRSQRIRSSPSRPTRALRESDMDSGVNKLTCDEKVLETWKSGLNSLALYFSTETCVPIIIDDLATSRNKNFYSKWSQIFFPTCSSSSTSLVPILIL